MNNLGEHRLVRIGAAEHDLDPARVADHHATNFEQLEANGIDLCCCKLCS
jgi:hypothetical protein